MTYQVNRIKSGIHVYLQDEENGPHAEKGDWEINIPEYLCQDPDSILEYVRKHE